MNLTWITILLGYSKSIYNIVIHHDPEQATTTSRKRCEARIIYGNRRFTIRVSIWSRDVAFKYQRYLDSYATNIIRAEHLLSNINTWRLFCYNRIALCGNCCTGAEICESNINTPYYSLTCEFCKTVCTEIYRVHNIRQFRPYRYLENVIIADDNGHDYY